MGNAVGMAVVKLVEFNYSIELPLNFYIKLMLDIIKNISMRYLRLIIRPLALALSVFYIRYCYFRASRTNRDVKRTVYFTRGTFFRDVEAMKMPQDILLSANILRRLFLLIVDNNQLQQIVCYYYAKSLRHELSSVISTFYDECEKCGVTSICFGGIDYFEVILFEGPAAEHGIETVAIFHENYTIPLVLRQTENIVTSYPEVAKFSRVYAIGPSAMGILKLLYVDVYPHSSKRFNYSLDCHEFKRDFLLIPFSDIAYFATVAFLITYTFMLDLAKREETKVWIKHKNSFEQRRFIRSFGSGALVSHVTNPSASELCASSRVVVCFNSLVYFEALAHGHLIAIPALAEAKLGEIYSQHCLLPEAAHAGIRYFSSITDLEEILSEARTQIPTDRLKWANARCALLAKAFY